jgi:hypothetical protein
MKTSMRALIFSLLIFPGAGLWVIGEKRKSLFFIIPTVVVLILFISRLFQIAYSIMDKAARSMKMDIVSIYIEIHSKLFQDPHIQKSLYVLIALFVVSGIYSYWIGMKKDQEKN